MIGTWIAAITIAALGVAAAVILIQPGAYKGRHRTPNTRSFRE